MSSVHDRKKWETLPQTKEEHEDEQLLSDLETELRHVQTLRTQIQQRLSQLLQDQKHLEQQQRRQQRQSDRHDTGAATTRMIQLQEKERVRLEAEEAKRLREEKEAKARTEEAQRRRENVIEMHDDDLDDLDAFLAQDAAQF